MLSKGKLLVVDDDVVMQLSLQSMLQENGYEVHTVSNGHEALRCISSNEFQIVLLDVDMPEMSGFEVCRNIRGHHAELPVVMITGCRDTQSIALAFDAGATDFLPKPIDWSLIGYRMDYVMQSYRTLKELQLSEARNLAMLKALPDTICLLDGEGLMHEVYGALEDAGILSAGQLLPRFFSPEAQTFFVQELQSALQEEVVHTVPFSLLVPGQDARFMEGNIARITPEKALCVLRDITGRFRAEQQVQYLSDHDLLTGLPNRRQFLKRVSETIAQGAGKLSKFAVILMDIDDFKLINECQGSDTGDAVLKIVAGLINDHLSRTDFLDRLCQSEQPFFDAGETYAARLGGDEFALLLPQVDTAEQALLLAQRMQTFLRGPHQVGQYSIFLNLSMGISVYPEDAGDALNLLKFADTAMSEAKTQGKNNCQFYTPRLTARLLDRVQIEAELREALREKSLEVFYQPQVDAISKKMVSVEALLRWRHPEKGLLGPAGFIAVAEESGLITEIGSYVLSTACHDAARWAEAGFPLSVAVNLSPLQLLSPDFYEQVVYALETSRLPAARLELEVTENIVMHHTPYTVNNLRALRALGVRIAIDDFGTGFSSLSYLKNFPVDVLKIDRHFVNELQHSRQDEAIVRAILMIAKTMEYVVVAEGVETQEQANILTELGCDFLQGYFYGKPQPFAAYVLTT
jgi:predicted signal transduction protein with EAL and GGDEF domain/FixJ family two-component response regulator